MKAIRYTPDQYEKLLGRLRIPPESPPQVPIVPGKPSKYRNVKTDGPARIYDSAKEARRAKQLRLEAAAGLITDLEEQPKYTLIPAQRDTDGKLIERECSYRPDFRYRRRGALVVEDVKSSATKTESFVIRRKLLLLVHGIRLVEV